MIELVSKINKDTQINGTLAIKSINVSTGKTTWGIGFYVGWYDMATFQIIHGLKRNFTPVEYVKLEN